MAIIEKEDYIFNVDIEKTKEFYTLMMVWYLQVMIMRKPFMK